MGQTFGRSERLKSRKLIDELFDSGTWVAGDSVKMVYKFMTLDVGSVAQAGVLVPKGSMSKAVDRNKFKRYMREAYRRNKADLYQFLRVQNKQCALMFIYKGDDQMRGTAIEEEICRLLQRLMKEHG